MERSQTTENKWHEHYRDRAQEQQSVVVQPTQTVATLIAEFALWLSVSADKKPGRRAARKAILISRWMQLSGDALKAPFPGVVLL